MIGSKNELINNLTESIKSIKRKKKTIDDIKLHLLEKYNITYGTTGEWIERPELFLPHVDIRELYLFTEQVFAKTGNLDINPQKYFTEPEMRESRIYDASITRHEVDLPRTFENATLLGNGAYSIPISAKDINEMLDNNLLHYDPELQREMTVVADGKGGFRQEPTLVKKNVDEIAAHMLNGTLVPTTLVWNAALGSSDSGEELKFDPNMLTLTVTKGTKLAIVDGFHRHKGSQKALRINPDLDFNFVLIITNYTKAQAQQYQAQLAEATPISKNRKVQLKAERYADGIVTRLMQESDLKDRISQANQLKTKANQLVSYNVLADSIDSYFNIISKRDATKVGDFLISFFDELIGGLPEEFIFNTDKIRKVSLINHNNMFVGYIILASRMFESEIPFHKTLDIIEKIDFTKENKVWVDLGVIDDKGNTDDTEKSRKAIAKYFNELNLKEMVGSV